MASPSPERRSVAGFPVEVRNTRPDIDTAYVLARLAEALALIGRHQPRALRRLRADVAGFDVRRYPCRGALFTDTRVCLVELTFLGTGRHAVAEIAATIVHEGMHARLARLGLSARPETLAREERLCREAELEFGLAIPDGAVVVERARQSLALADAEVAPRIDWAQAQRNVERVDREERG
ncbi:MAG TPA: hypothetical protein VFS40_00565 [Gemmatimonadales bacterium]|nr:hypothetical protein [Gemmatimonadales bacterium]